jgi:predicted dehydrogenase
MSRGHRPPDMHRSLLVGCGNRGERHAGALARTDAFEFAAVCDIDADRAEAVAEAHGVSEVYTDLDAALAAVEPTHVSAVFPPTVRLPVYRQILDYGPASLLVEKPLANTRAEADAFAEMAADTATTVTISHQHIYCAESQALRRWVREGRLGEIQRVAATSRGYLLSNGSHMVHFVDWLLEDTAERVRGFAEGPALMDTRHTAEPEGALLAADYGGTRAVFDAGEFAPVVSGEDSRWLETRYDVIGTEGRAEAVLCDHATLQTPDGEERVEASEAATDWFDGDWDKWDYLEGYGTDRLYADHGRVLGGDLAEHPASLSRALAAHHTIEAGLRAAVERRGVDPRTEPAALGTPTERRLRRRLYARRPQVVDARRVGDSLAESVERLAGRGHCTLAVAAAGLDDDAREVLDEHHADVAILTVAADGEVPDAIGRAETVGADTLLVENVGLPETTPAWVDAAHESPVRVAVAPGEPADGDALADLVTRLDVGACLSPPAVLAAGDAPTAALARLGEDAAVLALRDAHPSVSESAVPAAQSVAENEVPGAGGAVDFERLLATAVESAPRAHWLHSLPGERPAVESLERGLRHVGARRP